VVRSSRRQLLAAAATLIAAGCRMPGDAPERVDPAAIGPRAQRLDPHLRLSLPGGAVSPATITGFETRTGVRTDVVEQGSDEELLLQLAAGDVSRDVALVESRALGYLVASGGVETLAPSLLPNRRLIAAPFEDPPYDRGLHHSVPKDYATVGVASAVGVDVSPPESWLAFFRLARRFPGLVAVPDDADFVLGAALAALGHDWSSDAPDEISAAAALVASVRDALLIGGPMRRGSLGGLVAALADSSGFARTADAHFTVPAEGSVVLVRSYCVPLFARHPVSAHAWLNYTLDPVVAADETRFTRRPSPVADASYFLPLDVLADPAVYPAADVLPRLSFLAPSQGGASLRAQAWDALRA
jgi:spermidine/putrescine transport system substrate-binding protein